MGKRRGKKDEGSVPGASARDLAKAVRKAADALAKQAKRAAKAERKAADAAARAARKAAKRERAAAVVPTPGVPATLEAVRARAPEPEPAPNPAPEPAPQSVAEPQSEPEPEPAPEPSLERTPEPAQDADPGPAPEIVAGPGVTVGASVDVGANSVHLLVAAVGGHRLEPLVDESVFLGLGDRIDAEGYLGSAARGRLVAALVGYADTARRLGATAITFVGTEPMRRAADASTVTHEVERASGVPLHVLGHDEEGILTLLGVTAGRPVTHELVVVDVGGGSSEIVVVGPGRAPVAAGVSVGGARLTQRLVRSDPPTQAEINALAAEARRLVAAEAPPGRPHELVAVGGTVSNLLKVIPAAALERVLTRRRITVALAMLATEPSALASERHAVNPTRARILPAGAVIVQALLEHYAIERLRVSEDGIREGAILAAAAAGSAWRDRLPRLALGWRHATDA